MVLRDDARSRHPRNRGGLQGATTSHGSEPRPATSVRARRRHAQQWPYPITRPRAVVRLACAVFIAVAAGTGVLTVLLTHYLCGWW